MPEVAHRVTVPVEGMVCGSCAAMVRRRLSALNGVASASVNVAMGGATVTLEGEGTGDAVVRTIRELGFDCACTSVRFGIPGLRDDLRPDELERAFRNIPGVLELDVDPVTETVAVDYLPGRATMRSFQYVLDDLGYGIRPPDVEHPPQGRVAFRPIDTRALVVQLGVAVLGSAITGLASLPLLVRDAWPTVSPFGRLTALIAPVFRGPLAPVYGLSPVLLGAVASVVTGVVLAVACRHHFQRAWAGVRYRRADRHTLLAVALGSAYPASVAALLTHGSGEVLLTGICLVAAVVTAGQLFEERLVHRLGIELEDLEGLIPAKVHVERDGVEEDIVVQDLYVGDRVIVKPGEVVPADGLVTSGESDLHEEVLTGDALPVTRARGDRVLAGSRNGRGTFALEAEAVGGDTALARVLAVAGNHRVGSVEAAAGARRWAGQLVPLTLGLATVAFGLWYALGPAPAVALATAALGSILLVAAPNAVLQSVPYAFHAAMDRGVRLGIIAAQARVLETLARVDTVVFDKSGTITRGDPTVSHILGATRSDDATVSPSEVLRLAAAIELGTDHPVARAIVEAARNRNIEIPPVERAVNMRGRGVRGIVGRFLVEVISLTHARERNVDLGRLESKVEKHILAGRNPVVVVVNDTVQGLIVLTDEVKPHAKRTVARLGELGIDVVLLSGDGRVSAGLTGRDVGIERVLAEVPEEKRPEEINRFRWDGRTVAMVGKGRFDASALAAADVGIAIGTGAAITEYGSDITVPGDDLTRVVTAIELARETVRVARSNRRALLAYHAVGIPLAAGALYPVIGVMPGPVLAALAMVGINLFVLQRSARVRQYIPSTV